MKQQYMYNLYNFIVKMIMMIIIIIIIIPYFSSVPNVLGCRNKFDKERIKD
jgi:hypothetical protein